MPKIVRFHQLGDADVLQIEEAPAPSPGRGEVRLRVEAIGLNRAEVGFRSGRYLEQASLPSTLGYEAAGVVDALGEGVSGFEVGERVGTIPAFSMCDYGVYGEFAVVPVNAVVRQPAGLSAVEGAAIWMAYLTGYFALVDLGGIQPGYHALITAASSSVGIATIQLVKAMGAVSVATTRTKDKKEALLKAGADHVIVTDDEDIVERVAEITAGKGAEILFDSVAGAAFEKLGDAAAINGRIVVFGAVGTGAMTFPLFPALIKNLRFHGYTIFNFTGNPRQGLPGDAEATVRAVRYITNGLQAGGTLKPMIDRVFSGLDRIREAHRHMEASQQTGKIVVTVT